MSKCSSFYFSILWQLFFFPLQGFGSSGLVHDPRSDPGQLRLCRPLQPGGGRRLARQGDQPQPTSHSGTTAGHLRGTPQVRPGKGLQVPTQ